MLLPTSDLLAVRARRPLLGGCLQEVSGLPGLHLLDASSACSVVTVENVSRQRQMPLRVKMALG